MKLTSRPHHALFNQGRLERLALPFLFSGLLLPLLGIFATPVHADDSFDDANYVKMLDERDRGVGWNVSPGVSAGYTIPLHGYPNYLNSYNGALDIYFRPPVPQFPDWTTRLAFRLSGEYFALEVPKEVKGVTEDLYGFTGTVLYRFVNFAGQQENEKFVPFMGGGVGYYWDRITIDHPATGKKTGSNGYFGYTGSAGLMLPAFGNFRLIPEVRYHALDQWKVYWASHMTYQLALVYWIPAKESE